MNDMKFTKLDPDAVLAINKAYQASLQQGNQNNGNTAPHDPATPPAPKPASFMDGIMAKLREILGMEIGTVTIGSQTVEQRLSSSQPSPWAASRCRCTCP